MKIRQMIFGSLIVALLVGCSAQSSVVVKPNLHPEKEVSLTWKDTLDEGLISELDREKKLSQLSLNEVKDKEVVENEGVETENESEMESVESAEGNADDTEAVEQAEATQTTSSESVAPAQSGSQTATTVASKPTQTQPKNQEQGSSSNNHNSGSNNQVTAPKPNPTQKPEVSVPKEPERVFPDFVYEIGNSGKVFSTSLEASLWAEKQMDDNWEDPNWYSNFTVRSYFVNDNSPEQWTVDFTNF